jgi:hypothetical protein
MREPVGPMKKLISILLIAVALSVGYLVVAVFVYRSLSSNETATTSSFPEQFIADRTNFTQSITAIGEASDLSQPPSNNSGESFKIPIATERQIYSKKQEGIALSKKVSDAFLDYIHPDLKNYYRNKLIAGAELWYEGITANQNGDISLGVQKQIEGVKLQIEWNNWWKSHNEELADKAFPE